MVLLLRGLRLLSMAVALSVGVLPAIAQVPQADPGCLSDGYLAACKISSLPRSPADGLIHVTYSVTDSAGFGPATDGRMRTAMDSAVQMWNALSQQTGVVFEPATSGQADLVLTSTTSGTTSCMSTKVDEGLIKYVSEWTNISSSNPTFTAASVAHEIGHFLGLKDAGLNPASPTIMQNIDECAEDPFFPTGVSDGDGDLAARCVNRGSYLVANNYVPSGEVWAEPQPELPAGPFWCFFQVTVRYYGYWNDGWHIVGSVTTIDYYWCI